jgi:hypothetical protein
MLMHNTKLRCQSIDFLVTIGFGLSLPTPRRTKSAGHLVGKGDCVMIDVSRVASTCLQWVLFEGLWWPVPHPHTHRSSDTGCSLTIVTCCCLNVSLLCASVMELGPLSSQDYTNEEIFLQNLKDRYDADIIYVR